jgi:glutamine amidotransferase-like uncharacterized protein
MKPTIALFIHDPKCSVQSGNGIIKALNSKYEFKIFSKNELEDDFFDDVQMIAVPGGFGDSDSYDRLFNYNAYRVKEFVKNGGHYLGICMGAYWAGKHYLNILGDVEVEQYIKRPNTDTRRPHAKNMPIVWNGIDDNMFFYDGCAFGPGQYEIVAKYMNDDPMAIIKGRIGLIGCHPESQPHWYESYSWMKGKYHNGRHHTQLLEFVDKLMKK